MWFVSQVHALYAADDNGDGWLNLTDPSTGNYTWYKIEPSLATNALVIATGVRYANAYAEVYINGNDGLISQIYGF